MIRPDTFERVYAAIRQRLSNGLYRPGAQLRPALLADELNASITPIRDALHRLTGERLVEAPRHEGFRVPPMTESLLRHLYSWHLDLLLLAVIKHQTEGLADDSTVTDGHGEFAVHERQNALFLALARAAGNPEHEASFRAIADRLEPVRRLEQYFLGQTEAETDAVVRALQAGDRRALRNSLIRYHRRRLRIIPELLARMLHD